KLQSIGSPPVYMSGSGATLFIPFTHKREANKWENILLEMFPKYFVFLSKSITKEDVQQEFKPVTPVTDISSAL
ncbi:MAG: hypothetical protein HRT90_08350, partial [Candidatus Margulisbacteria bacterium]|nr:hypothetical protein [Candidatus Margulisiibacteriota bacterium]